MGGILEKMARKKPKLEPSKFAKANKLATSLIGMLIIGIVIISVLFSWRLASGPISLSFLTPYFEIALSPKNGSYKTSLKDTILVWISTERAVDIQLILLLLILLAASCSKKTFKK